MRDSKKVASNPLLHEEIIAAVEKLRDDCTLQQIEEQRRTGKDLDSQM